MNINAVRHSLRYYLLMTAGIKEERNEPRPGDARRAAKCPALDGRGWSAADERRVSDAASQCVVVKCASHCATLSLGISAFLCSRKLSYS